LGETKEGMDGRRKKTLHTAITSMKKTGGWIKKLWKKGLRDEVTISFYVARKKKKRRRREANLESLSQRRQAQGDTGK